MCRFVVFIALIACSSRSANGQTTREGSAKKEKGVLYFALGSHRIFYTPSTIRVIKTPEPSFDFTLEKVMSADDGGLKFDEMPQYSYIIGYYFKNHKFGLEYQFDHIKYFVRQEQTVHLKGTIADRPFNQDTMINPQFFQLEHSDGGNYAMINLVKWINLGPQQKKIIPELMLKCGAGIVIPKTNSSILGQHFDDRYYVSGYVIGLESGFRLCILKYFFVSLSFKGAFANYSHFLIFEGYGKQKWFSGQINYLIGGQLPL